MKTPMNVLLLEDDTALNAALTEFFTLKDFKVSSVFTGIEAIEHIEKEKLQKQNFDLFVIDINVPDINGLEILRQIRRTDLDTPVVIITASLEVENFATAFAYGCNEYIKKPFHFKELEIRIEQLLSLPKIEQIQVHKDFFYDLSLQTFVYKKKLLDLSYKEKRFCALLMKYKNSYVGTEQIHEYVWEGKTKTKYPLRQLITVLRKKLPHDIIETKIKTGYRISISG